MNKLFESVKNLTAILNVPDAKITCDDAPFIQYEQIIANELKYDASDNTKKFILYMQFVAWNCNSCSIAPLMDYANNLIFQELFMENDYFTNTGEKLYFD